MRGVDCTVRGRSSASEARCFREDNGSVLQLLAHCEEAHAVLPTTLTCVHSVRDPSIVILDEATSGMQEAAGRLWRVG